MVSCRKRTEPSAKTKHVPLSNLAAWLLNTPCVFGSGATSQSSGLVQMTALASPASTTMIVFDALSVTSRSLTVSVPGKIVALPRGAR